MICGILFSLKGFDIGQNKPLFFTLHLCVNLMPSEFSLFLRLAVIQLQLIFLTYRPRTHLQLPAANFLSGCYDRPQLVLTSIFVFDQADLGSIVRQVKRVGRLRALALIIIQLLKTLSACAKTEFFVDSEYLFLGLLSLEQINDADILAR